LTRKKYQDKDILLFYKLFLSAFAWHAKLKPLKVKEKAAKRDFISLNKFATQAGLVTAQEHFQYRATHADRQKSRESLSESENRRGTKLPALSDMVYGVSTK